jgi:hypothetical protein
VKWKHVQRRKKEERGNETKPLVSLPLVNFPSNNIGIQNICVQQTSSDMPDAHKDVCKSQYLSTDLRRLGIFASEFGSLCLYL